MLNIRDVIGVAGMVFIMLMPIDFLYSQTRYYVTETGRGTEDGLSWENASGDLAGMLNEANENDTIWVAEGFYYGGFLMKEGVQVFGGFNGNETVLSQRKMPGSNENKTILDGQKEYRVLQQPTPFAQATVWDGFVIQNGVAQEGAGVLLMNNGIIRRCIIRNNHSGLVAIGEYVGSEGGVVIRSDRDAEKAWVIAGESIGRNYKTDANGLDAVIEFDMALQDLNGMQNTEALLESRAATVIGSYYSGGYDDWYLPAAGEWGLLVSGKEYCGAPTNRFYLIENALLKNNMEPLSGATYWSSTPSFQNGLPSAWYVNFENWFINTVNVWQYRKIRGIRVFNMESGNGKGGGLFITDGGRVEGCLIENNRASIGSGICARGEVYIVNCTVVKNVLEQEVVTSSVIDANNSVQIINSIIAGNYTESNEKNNFDADALYLYSTVETESLAVGEGCLFLQDITEIGFADLSVGDYRLMQSSPVFRKGKEAFLPEGLDSDLFGVERNSSQLLSMGAFEDVVASNLIIPAWKTMEIFPNPVKAGEFIRFQVDLNGAASQVLRVELFDVQGRKVLDQDFYSDHGSLPAPAQPGFYSMKISSSGKLIRQAKVLVKN